MNDEACKSRRWRILHRFFELGVLIKGIDGGLELIGGLALLFLPPAAIGGIIWFLVKGELQEDPADLVANLLLHNTHNIIVARVQASVFLLVHGGLKLGLVAGLAANKRWSYPAAIAVFSGFTIYQIYQVAVERSLFLEAATVLDIAVIVLIVLEYRHVMMRG